MTKRDIHPTVREIIEKRIEEIDNGEFDSSLWEAQEKNCFDELIATFEAAGIHLAKEVIEANKERYQKHIMLSAKEHR